MDDVLDDASRAFHLVVERRCHRRHENRHAEPDDRQGHGEIELPLEAGQVVTVETDDQPGPDGRPRRHDLFAFLDKVDAHVLAFLRFRQRGGAVALETYEGQAQAGAAAHGQQVRVAGHIDRHLGGEADRVPPPGSIPGYELGQKLARSLAVDREVVVAERDFPVSQIVEKLRFAQDGSGRLVPLLAAQILDHVAEGAVERAAAACLDHPADGAVIGVEVPSRDR